MTDHTTVSLSRRLDHIEYGLITTLQSDVRSLKRKIEALESNSTLANLINEVLTLENKVANLEEVITKMKIVLKI